VASKSDNQAEQKIKNIFGAFLRGRQAIENKNLSDSHLDEDTLASFIEGALTERETAPILRHLVDCRSCRHITAELARLTTDFDQTVETTTLAASTNSLSEFWQDITARLFGINENAVFAHQTDDNEEKKQEK
jgi:hypothetical protein